MILYINVVLFLFTFHRIYSFLILSMEVKKVDDCIRKIQLDDDIILFEKEKYDNECSSLEKYNYNELIVNPIPYDIGQKIKVIVGDKDYKKNHCGLNMDISVNNNSIKNDDIKFWYCDNCFNFNFDYEDNMFSCYIKGIHSKANNYSFYFNINSLEQLDFSTSEYIYFLNNANYI